jgi:3'-phosphoadenosine 5'-phosphosulfate sulfotransferase (PAPS reductase)/FAD synthetase
MTLTKIIDQAVAEYSPAGVLALFSGGHDSVTSTHIAALEGPNR